MSRRISELPTTETLSATDKIEVVVNGSSRSITIQDLADAIGSIGIGTAEIDHLHITNHIHLPDGTEAAPALRFESSTGDGIHMQNPGVLDMNCTNQFRVDLGNNASIYDFQLGAFIFDPDNTMDLGAVGANRPKNGYFSGTLSFGSHSVVAGETLSGYITITDAAGNTRKLAVVS